MVTAVTQTGAVITSAGIVPRRRLRRPRRAASLVTLGQLGLIVGLGVLLDTFVVRTLLVPAVFAALGERGSGGPGTPAPAVEQRPLRPVTPPPTSPLPAAQASSSGQPVEPADDVLQATTWTTTGMM